MTRESYHCPQCGRLIYYKGLCWECTAEQKREKALALTREEVEEKQRYLIENISSLKDRAEPEETYFWECLSYHGVISEKLQYAAAAAKAYALPELYYKAPEEVRDTLIEELLSTENAQDASRLMVCLAMQGDDKALETLQELKQHPREWRKKLYVDPDIYAQIGGWTFEEYGSRREINYPKCYSLEKPEKTRKRKKRIVTIGKKGQEICPHCHGKVVDLLSIDGDAEEMQFLGIPGKVTVTCCLSCIYEAAPAAFGRFDEAGKGTADFPYPGAGKGEGENEEYSWEEESYEELAACDLDISVEERPVFYGANDWEIGTIGGFAHWIQDCEIQTCPDCKKPMRYLAQLPWDVLMEGGGDGSLYIGVCPDCRRVSIQHQQT